MDVIQKTQKKVTTFAFATIVAFAMALAVGVVPAFAATVPWNSNVTVTAYADDPTYDNSAQYINVTMEFANGAPDVAADVMEAYLEANTTIAGNAINSTSYNRDVTNVEVGSDVVAFTIAPNTAGMTANYNGKLNIAANASDNATIAAAMGDAAVETLVNNGITISKSSASTSSVAIFSVDTRAQARGMNHILITDIVTVDGVSQEKAIFAGSGTFSNGGITIHSHSFMTQTVADYAAAIVSAGNTAASKAANGYAFTDSGDGVFQITKASGSCSNIKVYMYDCDYLNANSLAVGDIYEPIWQD